MESSLKIEAHPTLRKVTGLRYRPIGVNWPGIPHGHNVILPVASQFLNTSDHEFGGELRPGFKLTALFLSSGENLHVSSADINRKHPHNPVGCVVKLMYCCNVPL